MIYEKVEEWRGRGTYHPDIVVLDSSLYTHTDLDWCIFHHFHMVDCKWLEGFDNVTCSIGSSTCIIHYYTN